MRLEDVPRPVCGPEDVVIQVEACGICGTDIHAYRHGPTTFARPGQILGHEFAGRVAEVGRDVSDVTIGDHVTAWPIVHCDECVSCRAGDWHLCTNALGQSISSGIPGAFAEFVRIPRARPGRTLYHLPGEVGSLAGALVEPVSVGLHAAGLASTQTDDTVVVTGLGMIGLCVVLALKATRRLRIIGVDPSPRRRRVAEELGADDVLDPAEGAISELLSDSLTAHEAIDVVCECSGSPSVLAEALEITRPGGTVVLVGLYGETVPLLIDSVLTREICVRGSYAYRREFERAIMQLAAGALEATKLVSHCFPLERISEAFELQADPFESVKVLVTP